MTQSGIESIALNRLTVSAINVRKTDRKADVAALAASIQSHGLLQNLSVAPGEDGKFSVVAGGRRLAALKMLAKSGAIAKDFPVPCIVLATDTASEASLAENVHRVAMDPIDEAEAFASLQQEGQAADEIARRFGVTVRHVEQRLALAHLSPRLKLAWKKGELSLEAARAFCLAKTQAQQEAVFKSMGKPVTHAGSVRAKLMDGVMRGSDRLVKFVGIDMYENAGGGMRRDLFDVEAIFVEDPALVTQLADEKLSAAASEWRAKGWGWVETSLDNTRIDGLAPQRLHPAWREPTEAEEAEMVALQEKLDALDADLDQSSVEDDPRWSERDDLEAGYETIRQAARVWDASLMQFAGVLLTIGRAGELSAVEGLVRKEDAKALENARRGVVSGDDEEGPPRTASAQHGARLPKALARELTLQRTIELRKRLASDTDISLAVCVAAMAARLLGGGQLPGVDLIVRPALVGQVDDELAPLGLLAFPQDASDALAWSLALDRDMLLTCLARLVAVTIDLSHEATTQADSARQTVADQLAAAFRLDMSETWSPSVEFWTRLPKTLMIDELVSAADARGLSPATQAEWRASATKMKKDELAKRLDDVWAGRGYLPELLITPLPTGAIALTAVPQVAAE